jgi:hypothetical protein
MKNSKTAIVSKKSKKAIEPSEAKSVKVSNSALSEADIRKKANEIIHQRIERGEPGTEENDWIEAEKYFSKLEN